MKTSLKHIYLDHHATTPTDSRVVDAMLPYFSEVFGNASSTSHDWGRQAAQAVEAARERVADLVGAQPLEIIFTSGATESINLALKGLADQYGASRRHIVTSFCEHPAVLDCCLHLEESGFRITYLACDRSGHLNLSELERALSPDTLVVSLMHANNEIGTLHDVAQIGALTRKHGVFFHCDASQTVGKVAINVLAMGIDLLSLSGHKLYGPKGVGALYIRRKDPRVRLLPQMHGGGHERGYRSGTLNVPLIVGLGMACCLARDEMASNQLHLLALRQRLLDHLKEVEPVINGDMGLRLAGNLNLRFAGVAASDVLAGLSGVALSTSSACSQVVAAPSRTLMGLGLSADEVAGSFRIGLGRCNTLQEMDYVGQAMTALIRALRTEGKLSRSVCQL